MVSLGNEHGLKKNMITNISTVTETLWESWEGKHKYSTEISDDISIGSLLTIMISKSWGHPKTLTCQHVNNPCLSKPDGVIFIYVLFILVTHAKQFYNFYYFSFDLLSVDKYQHIWIVQNTIITTDHLLF